MAQLITQLPGGLLTTGGNHLNTTYKILKQLRATKKAGVHISVFFAVYKHNLATLDQIRYNKTYKYRPN